MVDGAYNHQATYGMSGQQVTVLASALNVDLRVHSQPIPWYYSSVLHYESYE